MWFGINNPWYWLSYLVIELRRNAFAIVSIDKALLTDPWGTLNVDLIWMNFVLRQCVSTHEFCLCFSLSTTAAALSQSRSFLLTQVKQRWLLMIECFAQMYKLWLDVCVGVWMNEWRNKSEQWVDTSDRFSLPHLNTFVYDTLLLTSIQLPALFSFRWPFPLRLQILQHIFSTDSMPIYFIITHPCYWPVFL